MARRKKRAAPAAKDVTPEQEKNKTKAIDRLKFNQINVDTEIERMTQELKTMGEKMIKANHEAHEEFLTSVPKKMGNMTLKELFDAGYTLDYGAPLNGKFVSLGPCHYEIIEEALDTTSKKVGGPSASRSTIGDSRQNLPPRPDTFSTPAPPGGPNLLDKIITPKVVPLPKRGHVVVYTEHGSPYLLNLSTMKAKVPDEAVPSSSSSSAAPATRSTRTTRNTRAAAAATRQ